MRTFPIRDISGNVFAFEIRAQILGWRLRDVPGVSDVALEDRGLALPTCTFGFGITTASSSSASLTATTADGESARMTRVRRTFRFDELERAIALS